MGLFGKDEKIPIPTSAPRPQTQAAPSRVSQRVKTVLGPETHMEGSISSKDDLSITGSFQGEIDSDATVTVEKSGEVKANIKARNVIIAGRVKGNMHGLDSVVLKTAGSLVGDIISPRVIIDEGAAFKGRVDMNVKAHQATLVPEKDEKAKPEQGKASTGEKGKNDGGRSGKKGGSK